MARKQVRQFIVRLSEELDDWIEAQAAANCRSKNSEILFRLKTAMSAEQGRPQGGEGATGAACQG